MLLFEGDGDCDGDGDGDGIGLLYCFSLYRYSEYIFINNGCFLQSCREIRWKTISFLSPNQKLHKN